MKLDRLKSIPLLTAGALVLMLGGAPAMAQTSTAPTTTTAPAAKAKAPRTAKSIECSKEADAKGLHGAERKKFREECKKKG